MLMGSLPAADLPPMTAERALAAALWLIAAAGLGGCNTAPARDDPLTEASRAAMPELGLMTGLPLTWPLEASFEQIAQGEYETPWFLTLAQPHYELVPIDTLAPIPSIDPAQPDSEPLKGMERLAIIQPRGLSPADNLALDNWVRAGGVLLLALDPALTGHYAVPLTDPRHPAVSALIPPVVARWGLAIRFDEGQGDDLAFTDLSGVRLPLHLAGEIVPLEERAGSGKGACTIAASRALAICAVGKGRVTMLADAAVFEHEELAGDKGEALAALLDLAFGRHAP